MLHQRMFKIPHPGSHTGHYCRDFDVNSLHFMWDLDTKYGRLINPKRPAGLTGWLAILLKYCQWMI
jgi:hypothetical protein